MIENIDADSDHNNTITYIVQENKTLQNKCCFIWYMTDHHHHHIGIQIQTTNALHTVAYQVIPIILNWNLFDPNELPPDYQVSCHDLYIGGVLFDLHPPAIGQPTAE